jgi:hypothetical protein
MLPPQGKDLEASATAFMSSVIPDARRAIRDPPAAPPWLDPGVPLRSSRDDT